MPRVMPVSSELRSLQMREVIFVHKNNQKQTKVATIRFQLEELSVAFSHEFNS